MARWNPSAHGSTCRSCICESRPPRIDKLVRFTIGLSFTVDDGWEKKIPDVGCSGRISAKRKVKDWTMRTTVKALLEAEEWEEDLRTRFIGMKRRDLIGNTRTAESTTLAIDESKKTIEIRAIRT